MRLIWFLLLFNCHLIASTIEEKVGQLFFLYIDGPKLDDETTSFLQELKPGGILYFKIRDNLQTEEQIKNLSASLQKLAEEQNLPPLFIGVDQEGASLIRLEEILTDFPGNRAIAETKDPAMAKEVGLAMGKELLSLGINFNLSPVVDVNCNPKNPVIGIRSFGSDPEVVTAFAGAMVEGYSKAGVISTLKHFPGHGDTAVDSHLGLPVVDKPLEKLREMELYPYRMLANQAPAIMSAHILFPRVDSEVATFSQAILGGLLRTEFGYDGLVMTDSLTMEGVLRGNITWEEVAVKAFLAGNDILLYGPSPTQEISYSAYRDKILRVKKRLVQAVETGEISKERLDASIRRIAKCKETLASSTNFNKQEHTQLAKQVAHLALTLGNLEANVPTAEKKVVLIAPQALEYRVEPLARERNFETHYFSLPSCKEGLIEGDVAIFLSYDAWKIPAQTALLKECLEKMATVHIATRSADDLALSENAPFSLALYSPSVYSIEEAFEAIDQLGAFPILSNEELMTVANKIFHNETGQKIEFLTFWNAKEPFPSMGIGHFIWPPQSYHGPFEAGQFHLVLNYLQDKGAELPNWLQKERRYCPYETRDAFYSDFKSDNMEQLRSFLMHTFPLQADFLYKKSQRSLFTILKAAPHHDRPEMAQMLKVLLKEHAGAYVIIDYINFKGEGLDINERYKETGWGLLQVLQNIDQSMFAENPKKAFVESAKRVLQKRVELSPNPEVEKKWLEGWYRRLETYLD